MLQNTSCCHHLSSQVSKKVSGGGRRKSASTCRWKRTASPVERGRENEKRRRSTERIQKAGTKQSTVTGGTRAETLEQYREMLFLTAPLPFFPYQSMSPPHPLNPSPRGCCCYLYNLNVNCICTWERERSSSTPLQTLRTPHKLQRALFSPPRARSSAGLRLNCVTWGRACSMIRGMIFFF